MCFTLESWAIDWDPNEFRYSKTLSSKSFTLSQLNRLWQIWIRTVVGFQTQHQDHDFPFFSSWRYTYSSLPFWYLMDAEHFHTKLYHLAPRDRSHILLGSKPLVNFPLPFECLAFWAYYGKCNSNEIKYCDFFMTYRRHWPSYNCVYVVNHNQWLTHFKPLIDMIVLSVRKDVRKELQISKTLKKYINVKFLLAFNFLPLGSNVCVESEFQILQWKI